MRVKRLPIEEVEEIIELESLSRGFKKNIFVIQPLRLRDTMMDYIPNPQEYLKLMLLLPLQEESSLERNFKIEEAIEYVKDMNEERQPEQSEMIPILPQQPRLESLGKNKVSCHMEINNKNEDKRTKTEKLEEMTKFKKPYKVKRINS